MIKKTVLILGAHSDIAMAIAHRFAQDGHNLQLAGRKIETRKLDCNDIQLRYGIKATLHEFDALDIFTHAAFVNELPELPLIAVCAVGYMGEQTMSENNLNSAIIVIRSNYEGPASILSELANHFEKRGSGTIVGISSVAGERGRSTNYVYGSAKAGFTAFLSGLRNRLEKKGVHVVTVLPGFVYTKMTENLDLPKKLTAEPHEVGDAVFKSVKKKKDVIYVRFIWLVIMKIIRNIPEFVFKRLKL